MRQLITATRAAIDRGFVVLDERTSVEVSPFELASIPARYKAVPRRRSDTLAKVCDAVGYARGRGEVHRNLKPDNGMVRSHGELSVLD